MGNTILVADKSTTIQKIVQLTFDDGNFNIHTVSDGQAAIDKIPQIRPDLILADISLPVKNGYDLCTAIRTESQFREFCDIPVILLAGIYETMDEERARVVEERVKEVKANDFLSKPFDPQLLISKVKQYLSGSSTDSQQTSSSSMFAQEPESAINLFDTEPPVSPPDDAEKTMMLPGGPFGTMFASESVPYEEEHSEPPRPPVDIEAVKPANEPVYGEENFPAVQLGQEEEEEDQNLFGQSTLKMQMPSADDDRFSGRNEQEFEYSSGPVLDTHFKPVQEPESIPLILPDAEDPFGDVFQEPQTQWSASPTASEEDSPFGMPEPPPVAEIEEEEEEEATFEVQEEPASAINVQPSLAVTEPEGFDDTWPGVPVKSNMTHPVEELFESDAGPALLFNEDAEELEPDPSDSMSAAVENVPEIKAAQIEAPSASPSAAQISEELIERIAERVVNKLSERVVSEIVWQVVPDLAERMIRRELEKLHASEE